MNENCEMANADDAIVFLKNKINEKKVLLEDDALIKSLKEENFELFKKVNSLKYEVLKLEREISFYKNIYDKKPFCPQTQFLTKAIKSNSFICAYCGRERMKKSFIRIVSNKKNYTVCKNCIEHVRKKFLVEDWVIG